MFEYLSADFIHLSERYPQRIVKVTGKTLTKSIATINTIYKIKSFLSCALAEQKYNSETTSRAQG